MGTLNLKWMMGTNIIYLGGGDGNFSEAIGYIGGKCFLISSWMACGSPAANVHDLFAARSTLEGRYQVITPMLRIGLEYLPRSMP